MKRKTQTKTVIVAMALLFIALPLLGACATVETQEPDRSADAEIVSDLKVEGYLVLGESFSSDSSVTYSAFQVGEQFVVWTGPEESMHTEPTAGETERKGDVPVENIRIISGLYIKDDSFSPIVIRWGQATTAMQPEAATKWLSAGIASYSGMSSVSNFKVEEEGKLQAEGKKVLFAEVSYYEQLDGSQFSGLFAAWYDDNSSNVLLLSVMGTPETVDLFRGTVLQEIVIITDDLPDKASGDPLRGLNISRAKKRCGCSYMSSC